MVVGQLVPGTLSFSKGDKGESLGTRLGELSDRLRRRDILFVPGNSKAQSFYLCGILQGLDYFKVICNQFNTGIPQNFRCLFTTSHEVTKVLVFF